MIREPQDYTRLHCVPALLRGAPPPQDRQTAVASAARCFSVPRTLLRAAHCRLLRLFVNWLRSEAAVSWLVRFGGLFLCCFVMRCWARPGRPVSGRSTCPVVRSSFLHLPTG